MLSSIVIHFRDLPDPRLDHPNKLHKLLDIVVIVVWATLANQETWIDIAEYAREKEPMLRQHLELANGIPSHDTLSRAFSLIQPELFEALFATWMEQQTPETQDTAFLILI